ncbi:hypothetical protein ACLOJK_021459 [Asimina triloba]
MKQIDEGSGEHEREAHHSTRQGRDQQHPPHYGSLEFFATGSATSDGVDEDKDEGAPLKNAAIAGEAFEGDFWKGRPWSDGRISRDTDSGVKIESRSAAASREDEVGRGLERAVILLSPNQKAEGAGMGFFLSALDPRGGRSQMNGSQGRSSGKAKGKGAAAAAAREEQEANGAFARVRGFQALSVSLFGAVQLVGSVSSLSARAGV